MDPNSKSAESTASSDGSLGTQVAELRRQFIAQLDAFLGAATKVAFIEHPYDTNVGNHMMWLAGMHYFDTRGIDVVYSAHVDAYDTESLRRAIGDGPIVFNGGVGMSALWPRPTEIKRRIAREFPDNPILVFPSTVSFRSPTEQDSLRDLFGGHRNVFVMARDAVSLGVIRDTFRNVETALAPDSTFLLPFQSRRRAAEHAITWLFRNDHESTGYARPRDVHTFDWSERRLVSSADFPLAHYTMRLAGAATRLRRSGLAPGIPETVANGIIGRLYGRVSSRILRSGNDDLDRGRVVVTDRFHAHILAILRGQPVVLMIDAFGKNKNSFDTWTRRFSNVHLATTPDEALTLARGLAKLEPDGSPRSY